MGGWTHCGGIHIHQDGRNCHRDQDQQSCLHNHSLAQQDPQLPPVRADMLVHSGQAFQMLLMNLLLGFVIAPENTFSTSKAGQILLGSS